MLDRLIEEELLVQRGIEIGLLDGDATVRKTVAMAVIEFVLAQGGSDALSETSCAHIMKKQTAFAPPIVCKWRKFSFPMAAARRCRRDCAIGQSAHGAAARR